MKFAYVGHTALLQQGVTHEMLSMPDAQVDLYNQFFDEQENDALFNELLHAIKWRQDTLHLYGRMVPVPRLTAWYGDPGRIYAYSGIRLQPEHWVPALLRIKRKIETALGMDFNSVLLNLYRDGNDSVAWHSDDEPELGTNPIIASVSFGGPRRFMFRHMWKPVRMAVLLKPGSLLVMGGATQHNWQHQIPKTRQRVQPRINLTFRIIRSARQGFGEAS